MPGELSRGAAAAREGPTPRYCSAVGSTRARGRGTARRCTRPAPRGSRRRRGAAVLEFALIAPVLVAVIVAGQLLTELFLVRFELREAARLAAWDVTSRPTFDHEHGRSTYETAVSGARHATATRFVRFDGLGEGLALLHAELPAAFAIEVREEPLAFVPRFDGRLRADAAGRQERLARSIEQEPGDALDAFGFEPRGLVRASASAQVRWRGREGGGPGPSQSVALIAGAWQVADGREVVAEEGSSGVHPDGTRSALWRGVDRGKWLGGEDLVAEASQAAAAVLTVLPIPAPDLDGTYVVSLRAGQRARAGHCPDFPSFPRQGRSALVDLSPILDDPAAACFATQPLRDTHEYAASLQLQAIAARGEHFLGCASAQADDPSRGVDEDRTDDSVAKVQCGGTR